MEVMLLQVDLKEKYLQDTWINHLEISKGKNRNKAKLSLNRIEKYTD